MMHPKEANGRLACFGGIAGGWGCHMMGTAFLVAFQLMETIPNEESREHAGNSRVGS